MKERGEKKKGQINRYSLIEGVIILIFSHFTRFQTTWVIPICLMLHGYKQNSLQPFETSVAYLMRI